ncbi:MAG TPA: DUF499 domain-containing protein [Burkholderiales bacterium]|nr:DUF499 domain-containing protein [Burkholderiales bacterium]
MKLAWKPWHEVVALRDDIKTGELSLAVFAADLYDVVLQKGRRKVYEDPAEFFSLTYPTYNLRELVKDVLSRLAGRSDKAYRKLSINYGGGKTHTLITLRHLVHDPARLPDLPAVSEFKAHIGFELPTARVAALCFDKIDLEKGVETPGPDGKSRMLKHPWSVLAWQLAGAEGLKFIHANGKEEERDTPPAEPLLAELLAKPQAEGLSTLVLLDEVLMYLRAKIEADPSWRGRLMSFFQYLTQAVVKVDRCAMVASLLASDQRKYDDFGKELLADVSEVFGRQMEENVSPVGKEDVAEVLRRRFFKPGSIRDINAFRAQVTTAVGNIAALDERTRKERGAAEERYLASFPFHPDLTEVFYTRWTQLDGFQRTRGILRTFAIALRDAEKWDKCPLISANVFLNEPGKAGLAEAARELCLVASTEPVEGRRQEWSTILEGELAKARTIQSEATGLHHREIEQAVVAVFLNSQPIWHKALTHELIVLLGGTRPDKIELEKALRRWTELSWFLDEVEVGTAETNPDGTKQLPKAWRLGNRPNLRQMHHDACNTRVPPELIEAQLIDATEKLKSLTQGASAAGARVHTLPEKPSDIQDDGEFHFAVLGPKAASDSGKPSAEARRFIDETTAPDRPRVYRNAVVLAVPSRDGLEAARTRIREYLGWLEVREQLKGQPIDPIREQMLANEIDSSRKRIPEALQQAYSIVVTVNESNEVHAFKITVTEEPLFTTIKADKRSRIQETAISSEALMPGGPYDLWREGETSRRVKDLVGAFAQFPKLPKMLRRKEILDTVLQGVLDGIWVARLVRPDRSVRTFWRSAIDEEALKDPGLEVLLPKAATLSDLPPDLLSYRKLPGLWTSTEIAVKDVLDYFSGGRTVAVPKEGYEETAVIPKCESAIVEAEIGEAVARGIVWLTNGPASILGEPVPAGVLTPTATLQPPPDPIAVDELMAESIPAAWKDGRTNALAITTALSAKRGKTLPWPVIRAAIDAAIRARWIELVDDGVAWPCEFAGAQHVVLRLPEARQLDEKPRDFTPKPKGLLIAEATLQANGIQDLADQIPEIMRAAVGHDLKFHVRVEFGGETPPTSETVDQLNNLLAQVSEELKLR